MTYETGGTVIDERISALPSVSMAKLAHQAVAGSLEPLLESALTIREIPGTEKFYNAAAWEDEQGNTLLLGRKIEKAGEEGEPDVGSLVLLTLKNGNIDSSKEIWKPSDDADYSLEDARALPLNDGKIMFGLTAVDRNKTPHPAVIIVSTAELANGDSFKPKVIEAMGQGRQTTPLAEIIDTVDGKNGTPISSSLVAFRPEGEANNHQLRIFEYREDGSVDHKQYIIFPKDIPWASWRIGTTIPPIWLDDNQAIFPIHGITIVDEKYIYSIGGARLHKDSEGILSIDNISQKSLIDPDTFVGIIDDDDVELHSERRVVYCCGGIAVKAETGEIDSLKLFVNVGDKRTVEVTVPIDQLTRDWDTT